ncbi:MAG: NBR1-Ig-like domain-containing protein [Anaerolineales bacterium]
MLPRKKTLTILFSLALTLACVPTLPTTSAPIPTFDLNAPLTAIVLTANAAAAQTQQFAPPTLTATATPTRTPLPTETITPTFVFFLPTSTVPPTQIPAGSSGKDLDCQIISQDPPENALITMQSQFTAKWIVANVGLKTWPSDNTDYRYFSGDKLHLQPIYDFEKNIAAGDRVELTVAMQAPSQPGVYSTIWRITIGQESFCNMKITIISG